MAVDRIERAIAPYSNRLGLTQLGDFAQRCFTGRLPALDIRKFTTSRNVAMAAPVENAELIYTESK
ncbi:MAG: hypothetical protein IGR76_00460 [Synechococcales cyanobacterium T60_A2020_003]|nr:hypothetical protein [Synechococcales cyanobacterium T60_A2020_003]